MGSGSSKSSVRFERRNSRRQSQKNIFNSILNQTKDISNKMNEHRGPLTQEEYFAYKNTLENATKRLNSLGGQLKSKNANTYKEACQFVNDTFVYLETRMPKNIVPSDPPPPTTTIMKAASPTDKHNKRPSSSDADNVDENDAASSKVVQAVVEPSGSIKSSSNRVTLRHAILLPQITEEEMKLFNEKYTSMNWQSPMEQIHKVRQEANEISRQISQFKGAKYDEEYTNIVCNLDECELTLQNIKSYDDEIIRQEKKNVFIFIQQLLNTLEDKCAEYKHEQSNANNRDSIDELPLPPAPAASIQNNYYVYNNVSKTNDRKEPSSGEEEEEEEEAVTYVTTEIKQEIFPKRIVKTTQV